MNRAQEAAKLSTEISTTHRLGLWQEQVPISGEQKTMGQSHSAAAPTSLGKSYFLGAVDGRGVVARGAGEEPAAGCAGTPELAL